MLYYLQYLSEYSQMFNVARYITFRTAGASITALAIGLFLGPWMIRRLREFQIGQVIRQEGPATHRTKAGTPTMGGLLILTSALFPTLLWANLSNAFIWIAVLATAAFGAVGFADDYLKIVRRSHHGLRPRYKMGWQIVIAIAVGLTLLWLAGAEPAPLYNTRLVVPFFKTFIPDLGWFYVAFARAGAGRRDQRGQPHRRPRRSRDQRLRGRRRRLHRAGLRQRPPGVRRLPAADPLLTADRRAHGVLRRARRRAASASCGGTRIPRTSSWATSARSASAARSARWRS